MYMNALGKEKCSMNWAGWGQESTKEILTLPLSFIGSEGCQKTRRAELIVNSNFKLHLPQSKLLITSYPSFKMVFE